MSVLRIVLIAAVLPAAVFAKVEFDAVAISVMENAKWVELVVERSGNTNTEVAVSYQTIDGTAEAGSDYVAKKGELVFEPNETKKNIKIEILDENIWEPDETFFVKLLVDHDSAATITEVTIINDDEPGKA